jgi:hypothetical protein
MTALTSWILIENILLTISNFEYFICFKFRNLWEKRLFYMCDDSILCFLTFITHDLSITPFVSEVVRHWIRSLGVDFIFISEILILAAISFANLLLWRFKCSRARIDLIVFSYEGVLLVTICIFSFNCIPWLSFILHHLPLHLLNILIIFKF